MIEYVLRRNHNMKVLKQLLPLTAALYEESMSHFTKDSFLFDIETTGFSRKISQLYMIGYAYIDADQLVVTQLLAEHASEEAELLDTFFAFCQNHTAYYTFHGDGFDVPFLREKAVKHQRHFPLDQLQSYDLLKILKPYQKILKLTHMTQKDVESYLGISRKDIYSGGELIDVYKEYQKSKDVNVKNMLLLHNYEDLVGMFDLLSMLAYDSLFHNQFQFTKSFIENTLDYNGKPQSNLILCGKLDHRVPKPISYRILDYYITAYEDQLRILCKITDHNIRVPYMNYKDYYYLPLEDIAVLKELAYGVAKKDRQNATKETCYGKFQLDETTLQSKEIYEPYMEQILQYALYV